MFCLINTQMKNTSPNAPFLNGGLVLHLKKGLLLSILWVLSAWFGINQMSLHPGNLALIWLPSGISLILFLELRYQAIPWIILSSFSVNIPFFLKADSTTEMYQIAIFGLMASIIVCIQAIIAWAFVKVLQKKWHAPLFTSNKHVGLYFLLVCLLPSLISSGFLVWFGNLVSGVHEDMVTIVKYSFYVTAADTIGLFLVTPLYWAWLNSKHQFNRWTDIPFQMIGFILLVLILSIFWFNSLIFVLIPLLLLLTRKANLIYSIFVAFFICIGQTLATSNGLGYFGQHLDSQTFFEENLFLLSMLFGSYLGTITFQELQQNKRKLEQLVAEGMDALVEREEKYKMMAENVLDVIWVYNLEKNCFTYISPSVFQLRGLTREEAMLETINESLEAQSAEMVKQRIPLAIKEYLDNPSEKKYYHDELEQYVKDGSLIWIETNSQILLNGNGELEVLGVSRNINERKKAEELLKLSESRLRELNHTKDKFFSILGHDLMGPFNTFVSFCGLMDRQLKKEDYQEVALSLSQMQLVADRTRALLKDLLDWSRAQTGRMVFLPVEIDLVPLFEDVQGLVQNSANQKSISIEINLPMQMMAKVDKSMFSTIIRNLLSNAIKFTNNNGTIHVKTQLIQDLWEIEVADNGVGMSPEKLDQLFNIGGHQSEPGTANEKGTGLGLILCKEFVEKHAGSIWVKSTKGLGSQFYFTVPAISN